MILHCSLLLMFLSCVRTTEYSYDDYETQNVITDYEQRYSSWPSVYNGFLRLKKRDVASEPVGLSEGGSVPVSHPVTSPAVVAPNVTSAPAKVDSEPVAANKQTIVKPSELPKSSNETVTPVATVSEAVVDPSGNGTQGKQFDFHNPDVLLRAIIVFGGFVLLALAYYIFYKKKGNKNESGNSHNSNDVNQFRYGVLQSEDRRDNLELSRVPLTMESDDDDDEDLEIFDLEQKKKSLSYVNLQTNDEDIVFPNSTEGRSTDKDNLLLDIEDNASDTLINWSNTGNKSIL